MTLTNDVIGRGILRYSLAGVYLWFGFSQLFDSVSWVGMVPDWAVNLSPIPPAMIVILNGVLEIVLGFLLVINVLVAPAAFILAAHLIVIALGMGMNPTAVRDLGLTLATFALGFLSAKRPFPFLRSSNSNQPTA